MPQAMRPWTSAFVASDALSWEGIPGLDPLLHGVRDPAARNLALTPVAGRLAGRFDVMDHPGAHKTHAGPTPYLGGVAVAAGLLVIGWLSAGANGQLLVVVGGALVLGFVGLLDDVQPVSPWIRLAYQWSRRSRCGSSASGQGYSMPPGSTCPSR